MVGLEEYIKKYGMHFTIDLAYTIAGDRWSYQEIEDALQKKVYYNVAGFSKGDIVFLFNTLPNLKNTPYHTKAQCVRAVIRYMEDVECMDSLFPLWLEAIRNTDYDFTPYL